MLGTDTSIKSGRVKLVWCAQKDHVYN
jgi:hypothetical protein